MQDQLVQNHYEVLGIERDASPEDVRSAYRLRSHMFHPDKYENYPEPLRSQLKAEAAKEFKKLTSAYDALRDPTRRAAHDRDLGYGRAGSGRRSPAATGTGRGTAGRDRRATVREMHPDDEPEPPRARRRPAAAAPQPPPRPRERDPLLVVRPDRLDFGTLAAGAARQLPLKVSNAGGRTLFGEVTANRAWISVNRRSFISSSSMLLVSVDTTGLTPGEEYSGSLVVSTLNGGDQVVPVAVRVSGHPEPLLSGAPSLLDFGATQVGATKARTVRLSNAGTGTLIGSVAVKAPWLAVTESRFRGNLVSFEVIANTIGLPTGEHQGELQVFSNGGQATIQVLIDVTAPAAGGAIVSPPPGGGDAGRETAPPAAGRATDPGGAPAAGETPGDAGGAVGGPGPLPVEQQRELLRRIMLIEPQTPWERDFLRRIVQMIRAGERLAPGELARIFELEALAKASQSGDETTDAHR